MQHTVYIDHTHIIFSTFKQERKLGRELPYLSSNNVFCTLAPTFYHAYMVDHTRIGCLMAAVGLSFIGYENTLTMVYQHFHLVEVWQLLNLPLQSGVSSWVFFNSLSHLNSLQDFNTSSISWPCTYRHPAYEAIGLLCNLISGGFGGRWYEGSILLLTSQLTEWLGCHVCFAFVVSIIPDPCCSLNPQINYIHMHTITGLD